MRRTFVVMLSLALGGCASAPPAAPPAPPPAAQPPAAQQPTVPPPAAQPPAPPAPPPTPAAADSAVGAPARWWYETTLNGGVPGAAIDAAHALLAGRRPARQVVVAIIDGGVDITHEDMDGVLWTNPRETPGNRTDDDRNGFVDDVHGWNFIGGATESVNHDTFELTRLQAACTGGQAAAGLPSPGPERCAQIATDYQAEVAEVNGQVEQIQQIRQIYPLIVQALRQALGSEPTPAKVAALRPASAQIAQAQNLYMQLAELGLDEAKLAEQGEAVQNLLRYGLDINFNPRTIVGDNWTNTADKAYGNADVAGPDAGHGTAVASVVAAERGNGLGIDGVADGVRIMSVRTVPNGDERDKDVANAIRYAVDNGANIINMSFGKAYSPQKPAVDEAVRYADQRGVLMIHASGNDGEDLATNESYPRKTYAQSGAANLWIEVGASSWRAPDELAASFSNYGAQQVDLFAPGVSIRSAAPGNKYEPNDGTSLAAPVVTGVAALLMAYFPNLDAAAVKRILLDTATNRRDTMVTRPGGMAGPIRFGDLSVTGGVVNAEAAVRAALQQNR